MKLTRWEFMGLHMPMMEDDRGELYCTSKALCEALGINEGTLRSVYERHKEEFLSVSICDAKEFLRQNKVEFGIKRIRSDMRLWSEDDMLTFAFHSKSVQSLEYRKQLRQFIKQNAKRGYVSRDAFENLKGELHEIKEFMQKYMLAVDESASHVGKALRAQRETKSLRDGAHLALVKTS